MPTNYADVSLNLIRPAEDEGARQLNELKKVFMQKIAKTLTKVSTFDQNSSKNIGFRLNFVLG